MTTDPVAYNMALCEALGLDPHEIKAVTIRMRVHHVPTVEVEYSAKYVLEHPLSEALTQFELVGVMQPANGAG